MSILTQKQSMCDPFTLISTGDIQSQIGIKTIRFNSRITGEQKFVQLDTYAEILAHAVSPVHGAILLNRLANVGFQVSPMPNALPTFFHATLFPEDALTLMGNIKVEELPEGSDIEFISSKGEES